MVKLRIRLMAVRIYAPWFCIFSSNIGGMCSHRLFHGRWNLTSDPVESALIGGSCIISDSPNEITRSRSGHSLQRLLTWVISRNRLLKWETTLNSSLHILKLVKTGYLILMQNTYPWSGTDSRDRLPRNCGYSSGLTEKRRYRLYPRRFR